MCYLTVFQWNKMSHYISAGLHPRTRLGDVRPPDLLTQLDIPNLSNPRKHPGDTDTCLQCGWRHRHLSTMWLKIQTPVYNVAEDTDTCLQCGWRYRHLSTMWLKTQTPVYNVAEDTDTCLQCGWRHRHLSTMWLKIHCPPVSRARLRTTQLTVGGQLTMVRASAKLK